MVPASLRCRATSRPEPRSRPPCGVGVAAAAGLTRRRSRQVAHGLLPADCCPPPWPTAACRLLPATCSLPSAACCLPPVAYRPPPSVCHLLSARPPSAAAAECQTRPPPADHCLPPVVCPPAVCCPLSAAFHLPPWPPTATADCQTRPAATTPTLPPIRPIDATIGIAPAPLSDMPPQFRMQFPEGSHTRRLTNRRISTTRVQILKYTQGNCMRNCSPPDERRPQGPQTHRQTLIMSSLSSVSGTKLSQHTHTSSPTGTKLSPHAQKGPFQPVLHEQGELCPARTTTTPSRENFVPLAPPRPPAGRTLSRTQRQTRYKTLQTRPHQQPNRYKTLPTHPKRPISASFARAGRTLSRSHHHDPQQGELCPAPSTKPGTKLSQHTHTSSTTGTKLSQHAQKGPFQPVLPEQGELCTARTTTPPSRENFVPHLAPNPVQNSTRTPKKANFSPFYPSRENFVPPPPPRSRAGRTFYRTQQHLRYKTLPAPPFYSGSAKKFAQHT